MDDKWFMDIVRQRRSFRKFADAPVEAEKLARIKESCVEAASAFGCRSTRLVFIEDPVFRKKFIWAATSGIVGKVNPWMYLTKAPNFVVLAGYPQKGGTSGDRLLYLAEASMIMETLLLSATSLGLATCWMAGFGERGLARALSMPDDARIMAISPIGYPPAAPEISMDRVIRQAVSKSRKPMDRICFIHDRGGK